MVPGMCEAGQSCLEIKTKGPGLTSDIDIGQQQSAFDVPQTAVVRENCKLFP